jgi:NADPH:quinone reductase-like Zn-dependent oxidoreductase
MVQNTALWVNTENELSVIRQDDSRVPDHGELLIEVLYSGINPADIKHAVHLGVRDTVVGYDFCGKVLKSGHSHSKFSGGDLVAGYTPTGVGRPAQYGSHQNYLVCPESDVFHVPPHMPPAHAGCFLVVAMTAADALFNIFHFPEPKGDQPTPSTECKPLLIWGASTGVGICALQFARASGISPIIVTASPSRHEILRELGATLCFDYSSPTVVEEIQNAAKSTGCGQIMYALDAAGTMAEPNSADMAAKCSDKDAQIASVVFRPNPRYLMPLASTREAVSFMAPNNQLFTIPPRPDDSERAWRAIIWAVSGYMDRFSLPKVTELGGDTESALKHIRSDSPTFGKLVIKHPLI